MRLARLTLACALVPLGCGTRTTVVPPRSGSSSPPTVTSDTFDWRRDFDFDGSSGLFAILQHGTELRPQPDPDAPLWTHDGNQQIVRVIARGRDFTEVELDWVRDPDLLHCTPPPMAPLGLRVFVRESELADLTTRGHNIEFGPRAGLSIAPGVRVWSGEDAMLAVGPLSAELRLFVDRSLLTIGKVYAPTRSDGPRPVAGSTLSGWVTYGDRQLWFGPPFLEVFDHSEAPTPRVRVGDACVQITGSRAPDRADDGPAGLGGMGCVSTGHRPGGESWTIPVGVDLHWPDGRPAGRFLHPFRLDDRPEHGAATHCFAPRLTACSAAGALRVCVPAGGLIHQPGDPDHARGLLDTVNSR